LSNKPLYRFFCWRVYNRGRSRQFHSGGPFFYRKTRN